MNSITIAIITGLCTAVPSLIATIVTADKNNALQDERINVLKKQINDLSEHVERHNSYGLQLAKIETRLDILEKRQ